MTHPSAGEVDPPLQASHSLMEEHIAVHPNKNYPLLRNVGLHLKTQLSFSTTLLHVKNTEGASVCTRSKNLRFGQRLALN